MIDNPPIIIAIIALAFSIISLIVNHKIGGRKKVKQLQKEVNEFQKNFEKATKDKNEKELQHLKLIEPEIMKKMQEMLLLPLKSMVIILVLFFGVMAAVTPAFHAFVITLPFDLHLSSLLALKLTQTAMYGPRGFFILCTIVFNLSLELIYSKFFEKKEAKP